MWKTKLVLKEGESIHLESSRDAGFLGEKEISVYEVKDAAGVVTGSIQYTEHTNVKSPYKRTFHLVQRDKTGQAIVDTRWDA